MPVFVWVGFWESMSATSARASRSAWTGSRGAGRVSAWRCAKQTGARSKHPTANIQRSATKHQQATSNIQRSSKIQVSNHRRMIPNANWGLDLGASLDLGCWLLDVFPSFPRQRQRHQLRNVPDKMDLQFFSHFLRHFAPVGLVLLRQKNFLDAKARGSQNLLLDAAHTHHSPTQTDFAGHRHVRAHAPPG